MRGYGNKISYAPHFNLYSQNKISASINDVTPKLIFYILFKPFFSICNLTK